MSKLPYMPGLSQPAPDLVTITRKEYERLVTQERNCNRKIHESEMECLATLKTMAQVIKEDAYHGKVIRFMIGFVAGFALGGIAYSAMLKLFM